MIIAGPDDKSGMQAAYTLLAEVAPADLAFWSVLRWFVAGMSCYWATWMLKTSIGPLFREIER